MERASYASLEAHPVIFYNNYYKNLKCPRVVVNDLRCAEELIGLLIRQGHRHIACFGCPPSGWSWRSRPGPGGSARSWSFPRCPPVAYAQVKAELRARLLDWIWQAEGARPVITD